MDKKPKSPEEFGLTDKTIYIYPQKAMPYWLQFTPKEFLNRMIHDIGAPLYPIGDLLGILIESMDEGEIYVEEHSVYTNLDEHIHTSGQALINLWSIIAVMTQYAEELEELSDK
jgi:hypothetical protein